MGFTAGNDTNILQATDLGIVSAGAGDDRYVLDASMLANGQKISISDNQGSNVLHLVGGLEIVSSQVTSNALLLKLNNGAEVTILGADTFTFRTGGNAINGTGGTVQNFSDFVTASLGLAAVPAEGAAPVTGSTVTVKEEGGTTDGGGGEDPVDPGEPGQTFTLTTGTDIIEGTANNDTITATDLTYTDGDVILGGAGEDTLTINSTNKAIAAIPTVVGVENVVFNIASSDLGAAAVDVSGISLATITVNQTQAGAAATAGVTNLGANTLTFGSGITSTTTVGMKAGSTSVINAGNSSGVTVTGGTTGSATVNGGATTAAASITMTTGTAVAAGDALGTITLVGKTLTATTKADAATINLDGTGVAGETAVVSIGKAATIANGAADAVETLTVSAGTTQADPSVATITTAAANTYKLTGANAITLAGAAAMFDEKTVTSDATGAAKLTVTFDNVADANDLTKVGVTIELKGTANAGESTLVANNATVNILEDATADVAIVGVEATKTTNVLNLGVKSTQTAGITITNTKTVNLNVTGDSDLSDFQAGTADVVVTGTKALSLDNTSVAASLVATGLSGVLTATAGAATISKITGGSGNDQITVLTNEAVTVDGGAGSDRLTVGANATKAVFSNFEVIKLTANNTDFKISQLNNATFAIQGHDGSDTIDFNEDKSIDATTIDLSKLIFNADVTQINILGSKVSDSIALGNALTITGSKIIDSIDLSTQTGANNISTGEGNDVVIGGTGNDTIDGGKGDDVLSGGDGNDSIIGGEGTDFIVGGKGGDTIVLTETTSVADYVNYTAVDQGSAAGVAAGTFSGYDVVTGFVSGTDKIRFDTNVTDGTNDIDALIDGDKFFKASDAAATAANDLTAADITNVDKIVAFLNDVSIDYSAGLDVVAITFGDNLTALYLIDDADDTIIASEVKLIGTFDTKLVAGDVVIA